MILSELKRLKIIPVVKIDDISHALPLGDALIEGDLPAAEITFRTSCAESVIRLLKSERPAMTIGAGTILNPAMALTAIDAGADFVVSPGFCADTAAVCKERGVLYIPGCVTPTEIMAAIQSGIEVIKFFPAQLFGGLGAIKALAAVFGNIKFMPTGGVDEKNLASYLECEHILCCGGSFMVKEALIKSENFAEITRLTKLSRKIAH